MGVDAPGPFVMTANQPRYSLDHPALERTRQAVVDIGSNSVRLVVYDGPRRAPFPICNEKALCGLGRDMVDDVALNPAAMSDALGVLARFRKLLIELGDPPTRVVATAAVREAANGASFVKKINEVGFPVEVIGGGEEALFAAYGVVSFEPGATGLAGDMGGGSLELVTLRGGEPGDAVSLSIGPLRLMQQTKNDLKGAGKIIDKALETVPWLKKSKGDTLFAVGGAWRSIARVNMQLHKHGLSVLHHYEMSAKQAIETCDLVARQSRPSLEQTPGISSRRIDTLPFAALVLKSLIERAGLSTISVSAGGLREGVIYRELDETIRKSDPLLAGAAFIGSRVTPEPEMGVAYAGMIDGAFSNESAAAIRIRIATCLLADIGAYFHPDMRGEHAFDTALRAPFYGVTHSERAAIALSLFVRHEGRKPPPDSAARVIALLSDEEKTRAMQIGLALRFCAALAPKTPQAIRRCALRADGDRLVFSAPPDLEPLFDDLTKKRLDAAASALGLTPVVTFSA